MSEPKWTPGPWTFEKNMRHPWGITIRSGDEIVLKQDGRCFSSDQKTREDHEAGVGFRWKAKSDEWTRDFAVRQIEIQTANAHLMAAAPELYAALEGLTTTTRAFEHAEAVYRRDETESGPIAKAFCDAALAKERAEKDAQAILKKARGE